MGAGFYLQITQPQCATLDHMVWIHKAFLQNIKIQMLFLVREYFFTLFTQDTVYLLLDMHKCKALHTMWMYMWSWTYGLRTWQNSFVLVFDWLQRILFCVYDQHPYSSLSFDVSLVGICFNNPHTHRLGPKLSLFKSILQLMYYVMSCYYN